MIRNRMYLLVLVALLAAVLAIPAGAQNALEDVAITATFGDGPSTFSPVFCTDTACADIVGYLNVGLVGVDPETQTIQPGQDDAFAQDWEVSEDNTVYTLTLREDYTWSDGTQMTANDVLYN
ncbi:MAG: ABC transporter substrate-binding protein, partial [Chloroflexota bacterium]